MKIKPPKPINKMTKIELMRFTQDIDTLSWSKIRWFIFTRNALRVRVQKIYENYLSE